MNNVVILEADIERDRKTCISLDQRVTGANRELGQWLLDHPKYSAPIVAEWLGCGETRIKELRIWAKKGFEGTPWASNSRRRRRSVDDAPLESQENLDNEVEVEVDEDHPGIAPPEEIRKNVLMALDREKAVARGFKKIFAIADLPSETAEELSDAIGTVIKLWESIQRTLK